MPPTVKPRELSRVLMLLLALAPGGCGLADYEKKMQETDARLEHFKVEKDRFDAESKVLGDPLELPSGETAPPMPVFLRPPKSIAAKAASGEKGDLPFQYRYLAAAPATPPACTELDLIFKTRDDDKKALKVAIESWLRATGDWQPCTVQPPNGQAPMPFESALFAAPARTPADAPAVFRVYVHQATNGAPVALLFRVAQQTPAGADDAIKMSLETYADSEEATKARADYAFWQDLAK